MGLNLATMISYDGSRRFNILTDALPQLSDANDGLRAGGIFARIRTAPGVAGVFLVALAAAFSNSSAVPRIISVRHGSFAWAAQFRQYPARAKSISE
jgi:hypothetical protein